MASLIISFPDQSASFTHGAEFGIILNKMQRNDDYIDNGGLPVHESNEEVIRRACDHYGYLSSFGHCDCEGWISFFAIKCTSSNN